MTSPLRLSLKDVAIVRGERMLVEKLTIACAAGEALLVLGRNGSGKSSLLRCIAGLLRAGSGDVDLSPADDDKPVGLRAHLVTGRDPLKAVETVGETLTAWTRLFACEAAETPSTAAERVRRALADWNLDALRDAPCGILSSGQRRRTSLARLSLTTVSQRPLWLLDEPGNALDSASLGLLRSAIESHRAAGGIVIVATHQDLGLRATRVLDIDALTPGRAA